MKYLIATGAFIFLTYICSAQIKVSYDEPGDSSIAVMQEDTTVILHADPRLESILKHHKDISSGSIYTGHGFRVQIYSGNDRARATKIKIDFMRRFPGIPTYMSYIQPQFRVKVGDYRTRQEAQQMYHDASDLCSPCMIVPDIVVINTFKE